MAKGRKIVTPKFRMSFPSLFSPADPMKSDAGDTSARKPKYEVTMIFDPRSFSPEDKKRWTDLLAILDEASVERFKKKCAQLPANYHKGVRDGAEKEHLDGFGAGKLFAKASSYRKPGVVDQNLAPILDKEAVYAGCYARASVTAYSYENRSKGVALGLSNVVFIADGERLDGGSSATQDFGEEKFEEADDVV